MSWVLFWVRNIQPCCPVAGDRWGWLPFVSWGVLVNSVWGIGWPASCCSLRLKIKSRRKIALVTDDSSMGPHTHEEGGREGRRGGECACVCVCISWAVMKEQARERECVFGQICVCISMWVRDHTCMCVWELEHSHVCVCVCVHVWKRHLLCSSRKHLSAGVFTVDPLTTMGLIWKPPNTHAYTHSLTDDFSTDNNSLYCEPVLNIVTK